MNFDPLVTIYRDGMDSLPEGDVALSDIIGRIKAGRYRAAIKAIRERFKKTIDRGASPDDAKKQVGGLKKRLPAFSASGVFSVRGEVNLKVHSGLIQADFDLVGPQMVELRERLSKDPYVAAVFTSPSGEGLKAFYRVPPAPDKKEHLRRYFAVEQHCLLSYGVQIDESVKDMSRLCFVSDDPEAILKDSVELAPMDPPEPAPDRNLTPITQGSAPNLQQALPGDLELAAEALRTIPADERSQWLKIGAGLKGSFGENGWAVFDEWSKTSSKYDAEANRKTWDSLETTKTTVATVFFIAKSMGWVRPRRETDHRSNGRPNGEYLPSYADVPHGMPEPDGSFDSLAPVEAPSDAAPATNKEVERITALLETRIFNFATPPPKAPVRYWLAGIGISTAGNLTAISAGVKSGKTAAIMAMMSSAICQNPEGLDFLGFSSSNPKGHALIHIDTEQSQEDHDEMVRRSLKRANLAEPPTWLLSFCLTGLSVRDLQLALKTLLQTAFKLFGGIHSVLLDGAADFVADVNEPEACNAFVAYLHSEAILYKCPIVGIIHFNPGTEKTRGHLGSQLERKSETNLRLEKEESTDSIVMWSDKNRRAPILKRSAPRFAWSDGAGMHISIDYKPDPKTLGGRKSVVDEIATMNNHEFIAGCVATGETMRAITRRLEIWLATQRIDASERSCERSIAAMVANGKLSKGKDLMYRRGPNA